MTPLRLTAVLEFASSHNKRGRSNIKRCVATDPQLPVSSSKAPEFAPEQRKLFRNVLTHMNEQQIPYCVSGAFALQAHTGIWRDTKDLDLFLPISDVNRALDFLKSEGFETEVCDPVWLAKAHRDDFFVDLITGMSNGIVTVDHTWIERSHRGEVLGVATRMLGAEELIASKLFVDFRERFDGADIVHVIFGRRGRLDWERLLELVGEHWGLLFWHLVLFQYVYPAHAYYVPKRIWDDLVGRFQNSVLRPHPDARFRGVLVDDRMFAIDVSEWGLANTLEESRIRRLVRAGEDVPKCAA
jgi:nucleotidyltransferase DUF2204